MRVCACENVFLSSTHVCAYVTTFQSSRAIVPQFTSISGAIKSKTSSRFVCLLKHLTSLLNLQSYISQIGLSINYDGKVFSSFLRLQMINIIFHSYQNVYLP